jgi:hypothetical protein
MAYLLTMNARNLWASLVCASSDRFEPTEEALLACIQQAIRRGELAGDRHGAVKLRYDTHTRAIGWIDFVAVPEGDNLRIVTIHTQASRMARRSPQEMEMLSAERKERSSAIKVVPIPGYERWEAFLPGEPHFTVERLSGARAEEGSGYHCDCPDFKFTAGPKLISCKHIWAVRTFVHDLSSRL